MKWIKEYICEKCSAILVSILISLLFPDLDSYTEELQSEMYGEKPLSTDVN